VTASRQNGQEWPFSCIFPNWRQARTTDLLLRAESLGARRGAAGAWDAVVHTWALCPGASYSLYAMQQGITFREDYEGRLHVHQLIQGGAGKNCGALQVLRGREESDTP